MFARPKPHAGFLKASPILPRRLFERSYSKDFNMWSLGLETNCCLLLLVGGGFKYQLFFTPTWRGNDPI